jgi:hypothetical protein
LEQIWARTGFDLENVGVYLMLNTSTPNQSNQQGHVTQQQEWFARDWVTAVIVSLFTLLVALFAIILLASTLAQSRLTGLTFDGAKVTIWKLQELDSIKKGEKKEPTYEDALSTIKQKMTTADKLIIEGALSEIDPTNFIGKIMRPFVNMPPDILTLTLVIIMGLLGSSLAITNSVFRGRETKNFGHYFLQICVGAVAALVIFVVAKAGVPLVTDASRMGGDTPINPYFVSFLAIISGLMSERAIQAVRVQGGRFFGQEERSRWIRDANELTNEMNKQSLSSKNLADCLGIEEKVAKSIIGGTQNADDEQQKLIAIYLRKNVRDIFTDIPPSTAGSA